MGEIQIMQRFALRENFPLKIKEIVYKSCVRPATLHGSETWCLCKNERGILQRIERTMV